MRYTHVSVIKESSQVTHQLVALPSQTLRCVCVWFVCGTCRTCSVLLHDQVPAFETADGKPITESNAIAYYGECHAY